MIYFFILLILLFGSINYDYYHKHNGKKIWLIFEWFLLVSVMGFRYKVGGDTLSYMDDYLTYPRLDQLRSFDFIDANYKPLWYVFCALCKSVNDSFFFFQFVHSIIVNTVIIWFLKNNTKWYFTGILLYAVFFYLNFNSEVLRAALSVCAFLLGFKFLIDQKWVKYLIFCIIGYGFHGEALMMLVLPLCLLMSKLRINLLTLSGIVVVSILLLSLFSAIPYLDAFEYLSASDMERLERHGESTGINISTMGILAQCIFLSPIIIILYLQKDKKGFLLKGFLLLYIIISIQSVKYHVLAARLLDYLKPLLVLSIADTLYLLYGTYKIRLNKLLGEILIVVTLFTGFYQYFEGSWFPYWKRYFPYSSIFDPEENPERDNLMYMYKIKN